MLDFLDVPRKSKRTEVVNGNRTCMNQLDRSEGLCVIHHIESECMRLKQGHIRRRLHTVRRSPWTCVIGEPFKRLKLTESQPDFTHRGYRQRHPIKASSHFSNE